MHQLNWSDLQFVIALHREGSIRAAARYLGVNHTTVLRRISIVESVVGSSPFERREGKYLATKQGLALVAAAEKMEDAQFEAARKIEALGDDISGPISVSMPETLSQYFLAADIGEFIARYPNVDLSLHSSIDFVDLDRADADVVIRISNNPPEHLIGRKLFKYDRSFYGSKSYLRKISTGEQAARWLGWTSDSDQPEWIRNSPYPDAPIALRIDRPLDRHIAAVHGLGLIFEACFLADQEPELLQLDGAMREPDRDIWVLTHPDLKDSPKVTALRQHLVAALLNKSNLMQE